MNTQIEQDLGAQMYGWMKDLFSFNRSLTGEGNRLTLKYIKELVPELVISEIKSGTKVGDWVVPNEWNPRQAFIEDSHGNRVVDFNNSNLHLMGYSTSIDKWVSLAELNDHLFSIPDKPTAIPYVTSYYQENWGFCISENLRQSLSEGPFRVFIDASLAPGSLTYADLIIKGKSRKEVLFSTYMCHPSMANNELSGPVVAAALARWVSAIPNRKYTYRFVFAPETIGAISYLAKHRRRLSRKVIAGWQLTCLGDNKKLSFLPSRQNNSYADRISRIVLNSQDLEFQEYSFLDRGSDERQYCWPNVDLPMCSIMRSKYHTYPEYHTSLDNLDFVSVEGLSTSFSLLRDCIRILENNSVWRSTTVGEPNLGKRGLYELVNKWQKQSRTPALLNFLTFADGKNDLVEIMRFTGLDVDQMLQMLKISKSNNLISKVRSNGNWRNAPYGKNNGRGD